MKHTRTWTDVYGSACASFEGRPGGHTWLVAAPPELAHAVPAALEGVDAKGSVELLVHDGLTPLLGRLREVQPRGVLIVAPRALPAGPAVTLAARQVTTEAGGSYSEGGSFPEWTGWAPQGKKSRARGGECAAASAVTSLDVPVVVTTAAEVGTALEAWLDATPHGR
ncbi:hypothetical protein [Deinococcus fonticola]|uniref:hypothetical protein n=1 Tax=Deinococcus fonticola TaxID=2528713 RepID=UPI00107533D1|nr:hypothetical protein [Deinococcus fonticola]